MAVGCDSVAFGDIVCNPAGQGHSQAVLGTLGWQTLEFQLRASSPPIPHG